MALLLKQLNPALSQYKDRRFEGTQEDFDACLGKSTTIYVGNLSFYTTEDQIYEVFSKAGDIQRLIMGLDKQRMTPCGFCFVVYYTREDAEDCVKYLNGTMLDDRPIRADFDWGFLEGRQYGRGRSGGQVRDEYRMDFDSGRGGFGKIMTKEMEEQRDMLAMMSEEMNMGDMGSYHQQHGGSDEPAPTRFRPDSDDER